VASDKHLGVFAYLGTWLGLLALTGLTFGLTFVALGPWGMPVAILIAGTKSVLVVLIFMHLLEQGTTVRFIAVIAIAFLSLLCALTILDASVRAEDGDPSAEDPSVEHPRPAP
jgi:cytochrome c oxidase subunit IV